MKKLLIIFLSVFLFACKKDDITLKTPSDVSNVAVEPAVGGAIVRWEVPTDSNFLYLEVRYEKKEGEVITAKVSKYTDSLLVEGLLNRMEYRFEIQAFNAVNGAEVGGQILTTGAVRPIRRPVETAYFIQDLTKIEKINPEWVQTYTQETSEGPKVNLFDGNINTYWHSAWSANTAPLPHWIIINFPENTTMGVMEYYLRQGSGESGRPNRFALETSEDGTTWERQWTSAETLPINPVTELKRLSFGKNFTARNFRLLILSTAGNTTFAHLGEISFYSMREELTDTEELAEQNY